MKSSHWLVTREMGRTSLPGGNLEYSAGSCGGPDSPQWERDEKIRGKTVGLEQPVKGRRGEWGRWGSGLKLEPSPCSIKTPQRDLCRQCRPVERFPFEAGRPAKGAQLPLGGAHPPLPNPTQQNSAEDTRAEETSIWFRPKRKRMLKRTRTERGAHRRDVS